MKEKEKGLEGEEWRENSYLLCADHVSSGGQT